MTTARSEQGNIAPPTPLEVVRAQMRLMRPGIAFSEVMKGQLTVGVSEPRDGYADPGAIAASLRASVEIPYLDAFIADSCHRGRWSANGAIPVLGGSFTTTDSGAFRLFQRTIGKSGRPVREMVYDSRISLGGRTYWLRGRKIIEPAAVWRLWPATTTLEVRLFDTDDMAGPVVAAGILRLTPLAFLRQLSTMRVTGKIAWFEKPAVMVRFMKFFASSLVRSFVLRRRW